MNAIPDIPTNHPEWMTTNQLARILGVSFGTVRNWTRKGLLPSPLAVSKRLHLYQTTLVRRALAELIPELREQRQENAGEVLAREILGRPEGRPTS